MNDKENMLYSIADAVVACCASKVGTRLNFTVADVLGNSRAENIVMTRQILAMQIKNAGYTTTTIAQFLKCSTNNVRKLIADGYNNLHNSIAFYYAYSEATLRCRDVCK